MTLFVGSRAAVASLALLAATACSGSEDPQVVTETVEVEVLPDPCGEALAVTQLLIRRVGYYPNLVAGAAQSEGWPVRVMAESRELTREVRRLDRRFNRLKSDCLKSN